MKKTLIFFLCLSFSIQSMQVATKFRNLKRIRSPLKTAQIIKPSALRFKNNSQTNLYRSNPNLSNLQKRTFMGSLLKIFRKNKKATYNKYTFQILEVFKTQNNVEILLDLLFNYEAAKETDPEQKKGIKNFLSNLIISTNPMDLNEEFLNKSIENSELEQSLKIKITKLSCKIITKGEAQKELIAQSDKIEQIKNQNLQSYNSHNRSHDDWLIYFILYTQFIQPHAHYQEDYYHHHECSHEDHYDSLVSEAVSNSWNETLSNPSWWSDEDTMGKDSDSSYSDSGSGDSGSGDCD